MKIVKVIDDVWKISLSSNVYFLDHEEKIIIDAGDRSDRQQLIQLLSKVVDFNDVDKVLFTHLHYDHIGNFDLFPNARFYASSDAINSFSRDPLGTVLSEEIIGRLKNIKMVALDESISGLKVISCPGHTIGAVSFWMPEEKVLFSGDTLFFRKNIGRTDLPTSDSAAMQETLVKLLDFPFKTLCPGHDY